MMVVIIPQPEYRVNEVYRTFQGEGWWSGMPCTLVRLQGCNLRCPFCDTREALDEDGGTLMPLARLVRGVAEVHEQGQMILITGGEPALQPLGSLVTSLRPFGPVHLETNGTQPLPVDLPFSWIAVSPKVTWCGDTARVHTGTLGQSDEIKWLVKGEEDVSNLRRFLSEAESLQFADYKRVSVQPISRNPAATEIAYAACLKYGWRLSLQLHKYVDKK